MHRFLLTLSCSLLFAAILLPGTRAGEIKIGCVNMETLFQNYYKTSIADKQLNAQKEVYKQYAINLDKERKKLETELKDLLDKAQNIVLSKEVREESQKRADTVQAMRQEKIREIQQYREEKQRELQGRYEKQRNQLVDEIQATINTMAKKRGLSLVFDISGSTLNRMPAVVFYQKKLDFTADVLAKLNKGHEVKKPAPKTTSDPK